MIRVDIGIACSSMQYSGWWSRIMTLLLKEQQAGIEIGELRTVSSAVPDHNKNNNLGGTVGIASVEEKRRNDLTDANRGRIAKEFLSSTSDWLFMIDDDTVPPPGAISQLVGLGRELVAGIYFNPREPHNVIAYMRREDGLYKAILDYVPGSLMQVDSVGMGCTLIHRSVFERIKEGHSVFQRPNGSLLVMPNANVRGNTFPDWSEAHIENGVLHMPLKPIYEDDNRPWPFYALEYGRTEDHHFCELAANVGIKPFLDTSVVCDHHWKMQPTGRRQHMEFMARSRYVLEQTNENP